MPLKLKGKFYRTAIRSAMLYGTECWAVKHQHVHKMGVVEMRMLRWRCGLMRKDKIRNEWIRHVQRRPTDAPEWAGHSRFIRVMPNTPSAVGAAASVLSLGGGATEQDGDLIAKVFSSIGKTWKADEKYFDAVTGLSGSGPAYIYLAIEALADGGVAAGLPRELALGLASQTVFGAASMACHTGKHPGQLKDDVTSPGGTTIAGVHELEKGGFRGILMNAVVAAAKRSQEFSKS
ncbi:hypothetical protein TB2_014118 [Malus domestica]